MKDLKNYRDQIDAIDMEIVRLFEERMSIAKSIASYKLENNLPILNEKRELQVLDKVKGYVKDPSLKFAVENMYKSIMNVSKMLQEDYNGKNGN